MEDQNDAFAVGQAVSVESFYKNHLPTRVLGWERNEFLMTRAIYIDGKPAKLKAKDHCKVRYLKEGVAYGFESEIVSVQFFPYALMFIKYPAAIETLKLRVAQRFRTNLAAVLTNMPGSLILDVTVVDISEGGCGVQTATVPGREVPPDGEYLIRFPVLQQELSFICVIRKLAPGDERTFIGLEFTQVSPQHKAALLQYLDFLKKHTSP